MYAKGLVEFFITLGRDRDVNRPPVARAVLALDETRLLEPVNKPSGSAGRMDNGVGHLIHLEPPIRGLSQLEQNFKPGERQLTTRLELGTKTSRQPCLGLEQQTEERHSFVARRTRSWLDGHGDTLAGIC